MTTPETGIRNSIPFDRELSRGLIAYDESLGYWWRSRADNRAHIGAYRRIADFLRDSLPKPPGLILDYACGTASLLPRLHRYFPKSRLFGIDGSGLLLDIARRRIARGRRSARTMVSFMKTPLPNFKLPQAIADVVVYAFPNIVPIRANSRPAVKHLKPRDLKVARILATSRDPNRGMGGKAPGSVHVRLLCDRLISLNIRRLLKPGGICLRVEYGHVRRDELSEWELLRAEFEEGSLANPVRHWQPEQWFRLSASCFFRSRVIEDVYHQSGDAGDRTGGYFITVLRAVATSTGRIC